jgi:RNA polymerase sigma factor (sigma-70 family)
LDEGELIEGLKGGDDTAFIEVVDTYKKKIISLCYSYTQELYEAEDLSQEVFISLYKNIGNFRRECSLSTYIYRIAVSRCIDYTRKRSIRNFLTGLLHIEKDNDEDWVEKDYVRQIIKDLPKELKSAIVMYYYIGLSQKEIGEILGVTPKTVEGRIYRAKQKIKIQIEKEEYKDGSRMGSYRQDNTGI